MQLLRITFCGVAKTKNDSNDQLSEGTVQKVSNKLPVLVVKSLLLISSYSYGNSTTLYSSSRTDSTGGIRRFYNALSLCSHTTERDGRRTSSLITRHTTRRRRERRATWLIERAAAAPTYRYIHTYVHGWLACYPLSAVLAATPLHSSSSIFILLYYSRILVAFWFVELCVCVLAWRACRPVVRAAACLLQRSWSVALEPPWRPQRRNQVVFTLPITSHLL